jgi:hypothetical protein
VQLRPWAVVAARSGPERGAVGRGAGRGLGIFLDGPWARWTRCWEYKAGGAHGRGDVNHGLCRKPRRAEMKGGGPGAALCYGGLASRGRDGGARGVKPVRFDAHGNG